jgi:predicted transcriptional regulator
MKTLEIQIKSRQRADAEFAEAFKGAHPRKKSTAKPGIYFTSLEAVRALLTDKRLALLHLVREHSPRSINQLAKLAGRDFKNVHADIMLLKDYGLVHLVKRQRTSKTIGQAITVPYQAINIHAVV